MVKKNTAPKIDLTIDSLGPAKVSTPLTRSEYAPDKKRLNLCLSPEELEDLSDETCLSFEKAGPREKIFFDSSKTKCAIVTCGGLCPGINDVIRAIVMEAHFNYNVQTIFGIRYGLQGFIPDYGHDVIELTPENVAGIHQFGGTILGSSRGPQPPEDIVDALERMNVNALFMIGGDGTMKAAEKVNKEIAKRGVKISVIGVPKTIDNDINFVTKSFGFDTAVEKAAEAILSAHVEATGAYNGVGLVKLMGRESGFIAAQATLALKDVNFVLVPECEFSLTGENGLLPALEQRLLQRKHAVIVCAEGAGQRMCENSGKKDASGNPVLCDVCSLLIREIKEYFKAKNMEVTLKFIDPSYIIRSVKANSNDRVYCGFLGQNAVHAAMAGKTGMVVSKIQSRYVHLPLGVVIKKRRKLNTKSDYWRSVMETTGQEQERET